MNYSINEFGPFSLCNAEKNLGKITFVDGSEEYVLYYHSLGAKNELFLKTANGNSYLVNLDTIDDRPYAPPILLLKVIEGAGIYQKIYASHFYLQSLNAIIQKEV